MTESLQTAIINLTVALQYKSTDSITETLQEIRLQGRLVRERYIDASSSNQLWFDDFSTLDMCIIQNIDDNANDQTLTWTDAESGTAGSITIAQNEMAIIGGCKCTTAADGSLVVSGTGKENMAHIITIGRPA